VLEEHETGPELLLWLAVTAATLGFADKLIGLVTTIIKARQEGIKQGDRDQGPTDLVIRGLLPSGEYREKIVIVVDRDGQFDNRRAKIEIDALIDKWINECKAKSP
jgi:hypothetical protein